MKNRGITIVETLISTFVMGIIMVLMFNIASSFFKLFTASESRQSVNTNFIKSFTQLQRDLTITDSNFIYTYNILFDDYSYHQVNKRWLAFPVPLDEDGQFQGEGNTFNWKRIYIYYLACTKSNCIECPNLTLFGLPTNKYRYCSDKELIRLTYEYIGSNDKNYFAAAFNALCNDIDSYLLSYNASNSSFPSLKVYDIKNYNTKQANFRYATKKVIATNIFDMTVNANNEKNNITINISSVRKDDIQKEIKHKYGTIELDFTTEENKKYVDQMECTIITRNI